MQPPRKFGLYDSQHEHDSCGVGFVANIHGGREHRIIRDGLTILKNLTHRGAVGADPKAGDGAGILLQLPDEFMRARFADLPSPGQYAIGMLFMPQAKAGQRAIRAVIERYVAAEGQTILGWHRVPVNSKRLGDSVRPTEPAVWQVAIGCGQEQAPGDDFERKLFVICKQIENNIAASAITGREDFYIASFSSRLLNYKGMLLAAELGHYYPDLQQQSMTSALALVHQRFSTNTFPTWELAHPFRMIAHNGEINTLRGNVNWMAARKSSMSSALLGADLAKIWPLIPPGQSDSAALDNALELLVAGGYSLAHAMMLLMPEAWEGNTQMARPHRAFYEYHAALMEPWDGPAAVAFTDGRQIGATLDRNGLRPARYLITHDERVVMASEMGVLDIAERDIKQKWRLQPGKMLLIDLVQGRIITDSEMKAELSSARDYSHQLAQARIELDALPPAANDQAPAPEAAARLQTQQAFGYSQEDLKFLLLPMIEHGEEALGSMGMDAPPAVLSARPRHLSWFFKQKFAQVTNPPIDPIREQLVMSLQTLIGPRPNLFDHADNEPHKRLLAAQPVLTDSQLETLRQIEHTTERAFRAHTLTICYPHQQGQSGLQPALEALREQAEQAVAQGYNILILSDRGMDADNVAIPALLATSAVHHHLIRKGLRMACGLVVETGACLEVHHFATLAGYGAEAVNPYLAYATLDALRVRVDGGLAFAEARSRYIKAVNKGLKKVMSKMGISTYQSYCGAQIFDAVGLTSDFVDEYFAGTHTAIEGIGLARVATDLFTWHAQAYGDQPLYRTQLDCGGDYAYRIRGETHAWTPHTVATLRQASRSGDAQTYRQFADAINQQDRDLLNIRGLMAFRWAGTPVPLDEVEPATTIVKRFATGAMSFGSISPEAHANLAVAMNRIGGKSNTGEGGEEEARYRPATDGANNPQRSAIKQVASGRFGVTTDYLVNADDLQIKIAQGAKPGEGGQLPGHKVSQQIASVRHSTPGVGLISPPPHHDIYSIEDLAQLIFDLKNVNPESRVSVKLVSEVGVGTVAAGVSKAHADHVTISGYEGGTGASPLTSIKHAGSPWETGLAETHQTLVLHRLRSRIAVQVDGGLRTGRDVAVAALLGADEFGFATAPLIAQGCIMMRKCHLNTCPVGIATQDPALRKLFTGQPEHVINYFFFVAEELRQIMSRLGLRTVNEMIGRMDLLEMSAAIQAWQARGLDYSRLLTMPPVAAGVAVHNCEQQAHGLEQVLDRELIEAASAALERAEPVQIMRTIRNINRSVGAMLSGEVARRYGHNGLKDDTIQIHVTGIAGQSFGAWLARGVSLTLEGEANDYVGKGLSGGRLVIYPPQDSGIDDRRHNIIVGNTVLYGAISGENYFSGVAGERFCVRNSGAIAVVEGVGDHGCEYMTGGVVICLGATGRNFAAGMSGGIAYVLDEAEDFAQCCNTGMVALEPPGPNRDGDSIEQPLGYDEGRLKYYIQRHKMFTASPIATEILDNWARYFPMFVKVMPHDYRRALQLVAPSTRPRQAAGVG